MLPMHFGACTTCTEGNIPSSIGAVQVGTGKFALVSLLSWFIP